MDAPALDHDGRFVQGLENPAAEQFVSALAVKALVAAVLSWRFRLDGKRLHADPSEPLAHSMGCKLNAIVATHAVGRTIPLEQFGEHGQHIIALELALDMDCQALPRVLADHQKHTAGPAGRSQLSAASHLAGM